MPSQTLFNLFEKIIILVAFGGFLKYKGIIKKELQQGLSSLLVKAILPINILASANHIFSKELSMNLIKVAVISALYYVTTIILMNLLSKKLKLGSSEKHVFITMVAFANVGFIGFPIMEELYGSEGTLYTVIYNLCYQIFFFTYGINVLSGEEKINLKSIFTTPVTIVSLIAIGVFVSPFRFPQFINSTFSSIGGMMAPISLMIIGCTLTEMKISAVLVDPYSYLVSVIRLLVCPIVLFLLFKWFGKDISLVLKGTCIMLTALPAGSLNVIYAEEYDCAPEYAARTVVQSMVLMIVTLPLIMLLIGTLG